MILELEGPEQTMEEALRWLADQDVRVERIGDSD